VSSGVRAALSVPGALRWATVVAWAGLIFLLSNQPGLAVSEDPAVDQPTRHIAHVLVYAVLTLLIAWAATGRRVPTLRLATLAGVIALLYGVTDEIHQTFVPTRTGRPEDLVWDALGAVLGVAAIAVVRGVLEREDPADS
jgi:VanZ family protein